MGFLRCAIAALCLAGLSGPASGQSTSGQRGTYHQPSPEKVEAARRALARFDSPRLTRFADEEEFRRYLGAVLALDRAQEGYWASSGRIQFAQALAQNDVQSDAIQPICPDTDPDCFRRPESDLSEGDLVVTGSRIPAPTTRSSSPVTVVASGAIASATNPNITNNQMRNVEEGDIVKQINQFLLVLQDGRIFVVDTRGAGRRRLVLTDRADVYRDAKEDMWYDEMLVFGDRVLITGYSYSQDATELVVFRLDAAGRLAREGVFHMSSNDYYSTSNYATRLIGDNLVIYTPYEVSDMAESSFRWPLVRRWRAGETRDDARRRGRPLFDAGQIYRPVRETEDPTVHTVSVCPLGPVGSDRDLECRSSAFIGPNSAQWYVTESDAFLWTGPRDRYSYRNQACDTVPGFSEDFLPGLLYRVPVDGAGPGLAAVRGTPPDQFSLMSSGGRFRALVKNRQIRCEDETKSEARLAYLDMPLSSFGDTVREIGQQSYTRLPGVDSFYVSNRFTETHLVYGSLGRYRRGLSESAMPPVFVLPVDRPQAVRGLPVRHTVLRAERAGDDIVLTGYHDLTGLKVTLIDLGDRPRIASSITLDGRFESEGRSHAFNSLIEADGSGLMGLPTVRHEGRSSRAEWRSSASDLSFLTVDARGRLAPIGELERRFDYDEDDDEDGIPGYACEVSCVDWYGNSRPIFTDGRVFALTGTEMIEGRIYDGAIHEVQRINIARASTTRLARKDGD